MKQKEVSYVKYYKHWRDFDLLTCILAMVGLFLAIAEVLIILLILNLYLLTSL